MDGFVKVNWIAAIDKNKMKMGMSVRVRDSIGEMLAMLLVPKDYIFELDIAHAILEEVLQCIFDIIFVEHCA